MTTNGTGNAWRDGSLSQPSLTDIRQRLRQRFVNAGLSESPPVEPSLGSDLFFQADGASVRIVVLDLALWTDRQAILDSIMRASASAGKVNKTYLALPKTAAALTDARLFQEHGIGLFTYDQRNIEEALPPRYFETAAAPPDEVEHPEASQLEKEVQQLRAEFAALEQAVRDLKGELASSKSPATLQERAQTYMPERARTGLQVIDNLPTFLVGNPWVEVLSRRGRGESVIVS